MISSKIMSPDLGRVAYDRDAALYYGAKNYDENAKGFKPELLLLDEKDELLSETKNLTKGQMEAHMIATRIEWTASAAALFRYCHPASKFKRLRNRFCAGSAGSGDTGICGIFDRIFFGIGGTDGAGNAADSG